MNQLFHSTPHKRLNILTGEWVLVSPQRGNRPWLGKTENSATTQRVAYEANCYLCPGNKRSVGVENPAYQGVYVFENDFPAVLPNAAHVTYDKESLLFMKTEKGICKVICFSPQHHLTIPELNLEDVENVVTAWLHEIELLRKNDFIQYIQVFENKGAIMGCSNPHPHGQIWATESVPDIIREKGKRQLQYFGENQVTLLSAYWQLELSERERIVAENDFFVALVPFWAIWPFEVMIIPKRAMAYITEMSKNEQQAFAAMYQEVTIRYDNLFETSFPYSAGIHQAPLDGRPHPEWHWHMLFYPPLLRSATVKKFMVGYEMLAGPQRDITPESAAERIQQQSPIHYLKKQRI